MDSAEFITLTTKKTEIIGGRLLLYERKYIFLQK